MPCFPVGDFGLPDIGDLVWIEFEQGDPNKPIWKGTTPSAYTGSKAAAPSQVGEDDETTSIGLGQGGGLVQMDGPETDGNGDPVPVDILEPPSISQPEYGKVKSIRVGGSFVEVDGTDGVERIKIRHESGAYYEIGPSGQIHEKSQAGKTAWVAGSLTDVVVGSRAEVTEGNVESHVKGDVKTTVDGDIQYFPKKSLTETIGGNRTEAIKGKHTVRVGGSYSTSFGAVDETIFKGKKQAILGSRTNLITGTISTSVANKELDSTAISQTAVFGDIIYEAVAGNVEWKTALASVKMTPLGDIELTGPTASLVLSALGIVSLTSATGLNIGNATEDLLGLVDETLLALSTTLVATMLGPQPLSSAAAFAGFSARLQLLRGL
jgi:hypothetical protein